MARVQHGEWSYSDDIPAFSERLTIARLEWAIKALARFGITPHPASRLPALLRLVRSVQEKHDLLADPETREKLAEAQRVGWEFMIILVAAIEADPQNTPFTADKLREILGGAITPNESDTSARNTQFELYVPALLALSGYDVYPGPPDARFDFHGEMLALEAKRVRSLNAATLRKSLEEAANQVTGKPSSSIIAVVQARGIIAVNVDIYFENIIPPDDRDSLMKAFEEALSTLDQESRVLNDRHGILGYMAFGHLVQWRQVPDSGTPSIEVLYPTRFASLVGEDPAERQVNERFRIAMERLYRTVNNLRTKVPKDSPGAT